MTHFSHIVFITVHSLERMYYGRYSLFETANHLLQKLSNFFTQKMCLIDIRIYIQIEDAGRFGRRNKLVFGDKRQRNIYAVSSSKSSNNIHTYIDALKYSIYAFVLHPFVPQSMNI